METKHTTGLPTGVQEVRESNTTSCFSSLPGNWPANRLQIKVCVLMLDPAASVVTVETSWTSLPVSGVYTYFSIKGWKAISNPLSEALQTLHTYLGQASASVSWLQYSGCFQGEGMFQRPCSFVVFWSICTGVFVLEYCKGGWRVAAQCISPSLYLHPDACLGELFKGCENSRLS